RTILVLISTALVGLTFGQPQDGCFFYSNYLDSSEWVQVGTLVEVTNGQLEFIDGAPDGSSGSTAVGSQRRVYQDIGVTLNSNDVWRADFEFTPMILGNHNGQPHTGHLLLGLTAGTQEPFNNCSDLPCTGFPAGTQEGIMVLILTNNPPDGDVFFQVRYKDASSEIASPNIIYNSLGSKLYFRLIRSSSTLVKLSVFVDSLATTHVSGSPVFLTIPSTIDGLTTVQHGNNVRGQVERELTGIIDNLCITDILDLGLNEPEISKFVLSPNPVADKLKINNSQAVKIAMYDYHGRLVYTNHFDSSGEID